MSDDADTVLYLLDGWPDVRHEAADWVVVVIGADDCAVALVACDLQTIFDSDDVREAVLWDAACAIETEARPVSARVVLDGWPEWCGHDADWVVVVAGREDDDGTYADVYASVDGGSWDDVQEAASLAAREWTPDAETYGLTPAEA